MQEPPRLLTKRVTLPTSLQASPQFRKKRDKFFMRPSSIKTYTNENTAKKTFLDHQFLHMMLYYKTDMEIFHLRGTFPAYLFADLEIANTSCLVNSVGIRPFQDRH